MVSNKLQDNDNNLKKKIKKFGFKGNKVDSFKFTKGIQMLVSYLIYVNDLLIFVWNIDLISETNKKNLSVGFEVKDAGPIRCDL